MGAEVAEEGADSAEVVGVLGLQAGHRIDDAVLTLGAGPADVGATGHLGPVGGVDGGELLRGGHGVVGLLEGGGHIGIVLRLGQGPVVEVLEHADVERMRGVEDVLQTRALAGFGRRFDGGAGFGIDGGQQAAGDIAGGIGRGHGHLHSGQDLTVVAAPGLPCGGQQGGDGHLVAAIFLGQLRCRGGRGHEFTQADEIGLERQISERTRDEGRGLGPRETLGDEFFLGALRLLSHGTQV